jgi:hypothetical protein
LYEWSKAFDLAVATVDAVNQAIEEMKSNCEQRV